MNNEYNQLKVSCVNKWLALGIISHEEAHILIHTPPTFEKLSELLEENLPSEEEGA